MKKANPLFPQLKGFAHGGDYNPDQWLDYPGIFEKDIELMKKAGINCVSLGIFSWSAYEPVEGEYHFEWLQHVMDTLYENGIYTILATPSGARPAWLDAKYPDAMRVSKDGVRDRHGFRHNHCMTSENYRKLVWDMDVALAKRFSSHPGLLMWHLSNEYGGYCYCDNCKKKFQEYLKKKFNNDIHALNAAYWTGFWSHTYSCFEEIEPPYTNGDYCILGLDLEWKRFSTWSATDFMNMEIAAVHSVDDTIPVTANLMDTFYDYDYHVMSQKLDAVSWDSYPRFHNDYETLTDTFLKNAFNHSLFRSLKKDRPFMLMESAPGLVNWQDVCKYKRPGIHRLACLQAVACGSDTVQYFQIRKGRGAWEQHHGALIDHLGTDETRVFKEVAEVGDLLGRISEVAGTLADNQAAIVFDWDSRWGLHDAQAYGKHIKKYEETCINIFKEFLKMGIDPDVIGPNDDFSPYKVLVLPMMYAVPEETGKRIREYTANGGTVIATYCTGIVNETQLCHLGGYPGAGLGEVFGILCEETDALYPSDRNGITDGTDAKPLEVFELEELIRLKGAKTRYTYTDDYLKGMPAVTENSFGAGKAYYIGCRLHGPDMAPLLQSIVLQAGLTAKAIPAGVEYHVRYGENATYAFYLNYSGAPVLMEDVKGYELLSGNTLNGDATLDTNGVWVVRL